MTRNEDQAVTDTREDTEQTAEQVVPLMLSIAGFVCVTYLIRVLGGG